MSDFIYKKKIVLPKQIVFLCGAYYTKKASDKRTILKKFITDNSDDKLLPLIVDDFLNDDNIETPDFSIEQFEELISNISFLNFVFLESFSSAAELGLFSSNSSSTKSIVFYPNDSNLILDKIGYFIKVGVLKNKSLIKAIPYNALVERFAYGTDYVDEHYYFFDNKIPDDCLEDLVKEINQIKNRKFDFKCIKCVSKPNQIFAFEFYIDDRSERIYLSSQTAFYSLYALVLSEMTIEDILTLDIKSKVETFSEVLLKIIKKSIKENNGLNVDSYNVDVIGFKDISDFVLNAGLLLKYMSKEFYDKSRIQKSFIVGVEDIFDTIRYIDKEKHLINMPEGIDDVSKLTMTKTFSLFKNRKKRTIVTYESPNNELWRIQKHIARDLENIAKRFNLSSPNSFAYKKSTSTLDCVKKHIGSRHFLKIDLHNFFESMDKWTLINILITAFKNNNYYIDMSADEKNNFEIRLIKYINVLTRSGVFPIGFVSSPVVSNIYLSSFDKFMSEYCDNYEIIYTRYADDIMFSSSHDFDKKLLIRLVKEQLYNLRLTLNEKKTRVVDFITAGDSINYIGLNIVYDGNENHISLGRAFIRKLARLKAYSNDTRYNRNKIKGLESYLRYNDIKGYLKYLEMIKLYKVLKDRK